jgi:hypothetical protein
MAKKITPKVPTRRKVYTSACILKNHSIKKNKNKEKTKFK